MATQPKNDFFVVGIGAAAGGLDALAGFFAHMPPDSGAAFVVIQHRSPDDTRHLPELLARHTGMPTQEVTDGMPLEPNTIYLSPRQKMMTVLHDHLYLLEISRERGSARPIDNFFEALANDVGERAVGIILSGTGSDGVRGIWAIKEGGGMVMAQDESAEFNEMPGSAIATRLVDYVAPADKLPASLLSYLRHPLLLATAESTLLAADDEQIMDRLFTILQAQSGLDFTAYKPGALIRRIERRMSLNQLETLADYLVYLQQTPPESQILYYELLVGVTRFFRNPKAFAFLQQTIIPQLCESKSPRQPLRIWVAGCATGEEVYSLAILLQEYLEQTGQQRDIKIFATDLDRKALQYAGQGRYPASIKGDVSTERLHTFFIERDNTYQISPVLRQMIIFAPHNLIEDPPFPRIDLITCRNVLIYLRPQFQKTLLSNFQFSLNPGGFLFLGSSETVGDQNSVFLSQHPHWKVYQYQGGRPDFPARRQIDSSAYHPLRPLADWRSDDPALRNLAEALEASNEELAASNEELLAANEMLQRNNEELLTINSEYQSKIRAVNRLNDDLDNLFRCVEMGIVFLDDALRIRKFSGYAQNKLDLSPQDVGRPLSQISHNLIGIDLMAAAQHVLEAAEEIEAEIQNRRGRWFTLRITPYQTDTQRRSGVIILLCDATGHGR